MDYIVVLSTREKVLAIASVITVFVGGYLYLQKSIENESQWYIDNINSLTAANNQLASIQGNENTSSEYMMTEDIHSLASALILFKQSVSQNKQVRLHEVAINESAVTHSSLPYVKQYTIKLKIGANYLVANQYLKTLSEEYNFLNLTLVDYQSINNEGVLLIDMSAYAIAGDQRDQ